MAPVRTIATLRTKPYYFFRLDATPDIRRILLYAYQVFKVEELYQLMYKILRDWYKLRRMYDEGKLKVILLHEAFREWFGFDLEELKVKLDRIEEKLDKLASLGYDVDEMRKVLYEVRSKVFLIEDTLYRALTTGSGRRAVSVPRSQEVVPHPRTQASASPREEKESRVQTGVEDLPSFIRDNPWTTFLQRRRRA